MKQNNNSIISSMENDFFCLLLIFLFSFLLMLKQLVIPGYFSVMINDAHTYTSWAWQFKEALKEGIVIPKWMPLDMWGYGSPTFIIYPPLSFYMTALFTLFTGSITTAMNICISVAVFFSGVGVFYLVREFYDNKTALLSSLFYILLPYNILQFYLMGSFSSKISFMWFAPTLLFTYLYGKNGRRRNLVYASLCYGALICTHIINAYMFSFVLLAFLFYMSAYGKKTKDIARIVTVIPIGIMLSAAYVLPLIFEKRLINLQGFFTKGSGLYYAAHFILPDRTGEVPAGLFWPVYYKMFIMIVLFFVTAILMFYVPSLKKMQNRDDGERKKLTTLFFFVATVSVFLLFGPSAFIWETVPFFKYIHFPVRWLNITAFAVTMLFASFSFLLMHNGKSSRYFHIATAVLFFAFIYLDCHYIYRASIFNERELVPLRVENSSIDHQLPWVDVKILDKKSGFEKKLNILEGKGRTQAVEWKSAERIIDAEAFQAMVLRIRTFNFPGWKAYLDGREIGIKSEDKTGMILVDVPEGTHRIKLVFEDTAVRFYGKVVSLLSVLSLLLFGLLGKRKGTKTKIG
ncbi:MAG: hypothetical protein H6R39_165 [Deltaproteobacteria bacterium]|nr:hypothetical protein [Deltaproteobacteria bacterium]